VDLSAWESIDLRALGVFRIAIGTIAVIDVARRFPLIELFYSNSGLLSNHFSLFLPFNEFSFSLLYAFSRPAEVRVVFLLILGCAVVFTLGYRTRLFHALTLAGVLSIHGRNPMVENGGDVVLNLMLVWALVLPLGARFGIDAVRASRARAPEARTPEVDRPIRVPPDRARSLAVTVVLLQLAVIYFLNAVQKDGATWREGTALAYILEQDRTVTWLGVWARDLPFGVTRLLTWGAQAIEALAPALILSPIAVTACRRIAIVALSALHVGIAALIDVGLFSWVMLACLPLLLTTADFDLISRVRLRLASRKMFAAARARARSDAWLGVPPGSLSEGPAQQSASPATWASARRAVQRVGHIGGEIAVAVVLLACASQVLIENRFFTERVPFTQPRWARAIVEYGRLFQGWGMFAPDAPTRDGWLVIDAVLADGTHIDPQTGRTPAFEVADHRRLRWDSFWDAYSARIVSPRAAPYREELRRWLVGPHRRLRLPEGQTIVRADVWWIGDVSPDPRMPRRPPMEIGRVRIAQFDARQAPDGGRER